MIKNNLTKVKTYSIQEKKQSKAIFRKNKVLSTEIKSPAPFSKNATTSNCLVLPYTDFGSYVTPKFICNFIWVAIE